MKKIVFGSFVCVLLVSTLTFADGGSPSGDGPGNSSQPALPSCSNLLFPPTVNAPAGNYTFQPVGTKCVTRSNAVFERVSINGFGQGWKAPNGIVWSDPVGGINREAGNPFNSVTDYDAQNMDMKRSEAFNACTKIHGRLPTRSEAVAAGKYGISEILPYGNFWTSSADYGKDIRLRTMSFLIGDFGEARDLVTNRLVALDPLIYDVLSNYNHMSSDYSQNSSEGNDGTSIHKESAAETDGVVCLASDPSEKNIAASRDPKIANNRVAEQKTPLVAPASDSSPAVPAEFTAAGSAQ